MQQPPALLKASNINIDMKFLKQLAQPSLDTSTPLLNASTSTLAQLLKLKNSKYSFSQQSKQTGQQWMKRKGADLRPLIDRVQVQKQKAKGMEEEKKCEVDCHFYMEKVNFETQVQYIEKNFEFGVFMAVQSIMSEEKSKGSLAKRILNRRKINRDNGVVSLLDSLPTVNLQIRSPDKKLAYVGKTKQIVSSQVSTKDAEWARLYKQSTNLHFWSIMADQLAQFALPSAKQIPLSSMAQSSLKLVQRELQTLLPTNYESVLYYLTNNYLGKMRGQYQSEGSHGPIWGICYMLYRAGRREEFYQCVPDEELKRLFQLADVSIREGKPKKFAGVDENNDLFHDQLIYALKGISKCSTQALCDPNNLDIVWVFLRNVGIFEQNLSTFISLRKQLYDSYRGPLITQAKIKNLLYLLGYGQIAQIGINDIMDQDDYLHYLIAVYHTPACQTLDKDRKQIVQRRLTQEICQYIHELLLQRKDEYIYYMVLMPTSRMSEEASSIIASSKILETIDWNFLRNKLSYSQYEKLVSSSLEKYVTLHQQYVEVATKCVQLLNNNRRGLDFLLEMFVKALLSSKYSKDELNRGKSLAQDLCRKDEKLSAEYAPVFNFFSEYLRLIGLVQQRNQSRIYEFLRESNFILLSEQLRIDTKLCLDKLIEHRGFECYINYTKTMMKAFQIALVRLGRLADLQELQNLTLIALINLVRTEPYTQFANRQSVKELIRTLEEALSRTG